jgi:vancomycin permeability regulator SanA
VKRRRLLLAAVVLVAAVFGGRLLMLGAARGTPDADALEPLRPGEHRVAIIFGAGLAPGGARPSPLLDDRLRAGEDLLARGLVDRLLMTGDNSVAPYNEPGVMRRASIARGVPVDAIAVDYGGRRTWDSCRRARDVFGVRNAVVVSSDFHRARTIAVCRAAGIEVTGGVGADTAGYGLRARTGWRVRELAASWRGVMDAWIRHPEVPVGGDPIDIYDPAAVRASLSAEDRAVTAP